jgi:hypothetical protein
VQISVGAGGLMIGDITVGGETRPPGVVLN